MMPLAYLLLGAALSAIGFYGIFANSHLLRRIVASNVLSSGVFVFLVAATHEPGRQHADPVAQALVLTGIVVAVSVTAFALSLLRRLVGACDRVRLPEDGE